MYVQFCYVMEQRQCSTFQWTIPYQMLVATFSLSLVSDETKSRQGMLVRVWKELLQYMAAHLHVDNDNLSMDRLIIPNMFSHWQQFIGEILYPWVLGHASTCKHLQAQIQAIAFNLHFTFEWIRWIYVELNWRTLWQYFIFIISCFRCLGAYGESRRWRQ